MALRPRFFLALVVAFAAALLMPAVARALQITVDPPDTLTVTWSEEWNTPGNLDSWTTSQTSGAVQTSGTDVVFAGTASGTDAQIIRSNFSSGPDLDLGYNDFIELRVKVPAAYTGAIQIYYGTTSYTIYNSSGGTTTAATTGFSASRVISIPASSIPADGAFHVYRIDAGLEPAWRATLRDLRIDPVGGAGTSGMTFAVDYIRIGDEPNATVYQPRITTECPLAGGTDPLNGQIVSSMESKHFRFLYTATGTSSSYWTSDMPHGTLRNLEEAWQVYVKKFGYREPCQDSQTQSGTKYKTNFTTWHSGYWCGIDSYNGTGLARLNITPDGLRVDPATWVIPHEFRHAIQMHNTTGNVPGEWFEFDANYGRERWIQHYQTFFPTMSGIDTIALRCAHQLIGEGRDYYLCWPLLLYLDANPDGLPDLGEGTVMKLWQQTQSGEYSMMALDRLTPSTSLKDIVGCFARHGATYSYPTQAIIQATLAKNGAPADNAATQRWQFTDLVQRSDDSTWWRVPFEMAPMQGGYAIHELVVSGSGTPGRVVTVNLHCLPNATRGADLRASFIVVTDNSNERYSTVWGNGTNSVTLSGTENKLYLSVAGAPDVFYQGGQDDSVNPYRTDTSKTRFPYELQVTGASPKQRDNGAITGLVQHSNGGGYKASTATVASTVYLGPNARVLDTANVSGTARIEDFAVVQGPSRVSGSAVISGHAWVRGNAVVKDYAKVRDWALVEGGTIASSARVLEHANIRGGVVMDLATAKGSAASASGTLSGNTIIDGDFGDYAYGRNISNGIAFGHMPYVGVPDSWIRALPDGLYAAYDFATAHDSRILDQYGVTDGFTAGSPGWVAADARRKGFLVFDGSTQYVSLDRSLADFREFTFAAWVKPLGGAGGQPLLWLGASTSQRLYFTANDGAGHAKFAICNGGADQTLTAALLPSGLWTHVAITLDGTTGVLYVNGTSSASGAVAIRPDQLLAPNTAAGGQQNYLARSQGSALPMFRGALDDMQFYGKALAASAIAAMQPATSLTTSGTLYVDLRADDASAGKAAWVNSGTLGNFTRTGSPSYVANVASTNIPGVSFNGTTDAYTGPNTVADIDGSGDRTVEVWAYNPALLDEETTVSWGHRGTTDRDMAFNFGQHATWGAATHWGDDVSWGSSIPSANAWHHLVYTYDGAKTVTLYVDGAQANIQTLSGTLNTFPGEPINIGCQRDTANGSRSLLFSGYINRVRVHGGVLSAAQVAGNYSLGPVGAPANAAPTLGAISSVVLDYGTPASVPLVVGDSDTALASLTLSASSANEVLLPAWGITFSGTGSARTMVVAPAGTSGSTSLTVTVSDGLATASRTFNITVLSALDTWRRQTFGTTSNSGIAADSADPDGDGMTNLQEFAAGTDPLDARSALRLGQVQVSGSSVTISFPSILGKSYRLERADTLPASSWTVILDYFTGTGGTMQVVDPNGAAQPTRFYHIVAQ